MHWSALTLLFAATVLGAPAPIPADVELSITPEQRFQGDGFYLAVFDDAGVANVTFTPKADLLARSAAPVSENLAARAVNTLSKRKTVCAGRSTHVGDLDWANVQLANNGNNKWYNKGAWGWVHNNAETSFFCNYQRNYLTYNLIIEMQTVVSVTCQGSSGYGYDRRTNGGGANDLAVGRTFNGDNFCDGKYHS